ncbi:Asp-tRNA(Asn)/Glu-tRNA(Gln) amidotransferase subunit GatA [Sulfuriroseicoccus oceanibius]|uniref:Glutamyl-tRNA(Gln) amidotransferase subunit A n=1 Tax=Sulfuriroseicoccus oceanibius TaxID=2707525 RepID=A0A6B3LEU6_9BACT|nr:Asp-tRNA(Asn)/Glu-tRNA(Gln) amidotransferase subunit GatA [Sulfuriroseicoccus oceanibius]QQL44982.1 Asp-tRNA(Asn)/Glu-tRNA(Gln) amidotransferase subunit GatA [Sulfuriroseicoccus oceanibius]
MSLAASTITDLRAKLVEGTITPADIINDIRKANEAADPRVTGYLSLDYDAALAEAENADLSLPLGGIPIAIKDNINVKGQGCGCASKLLTGGYTSPYDATVIAKLRAAGAIPLGRTNMDEFAMGSTTENSATGETRNPWDIDRVPGGSSGGSGAAVGARTAVAALGSDTGGSIRQPAAFNGIVGLKPSYGRVSRYGLVAFASSLDQIGPMTRSVEDAALMLNVMAGSDIQDSTSAQIDVPDYTAGLDGDLNGLRVGVPKEFFGEGLDADVKASVDAAIAKLEELGAEIVEVSLPHTEYAVATYYIIATAEASANLARFDGVRYGNRAEDPADLLQLYTRTRELGFGEEVKRRILLGTYVLSSGYYDAYYLQAQKARTLFRRDFEAAFEKVDVIVGPTSPGPAFEAGSLTADPLQMYLADIYTISANLAGIPAMSQPCGFVEREAGKPLPVGLQLMAKPFDEQTLLKVGAAYERATDWHTRAPGA